MITSTHQGKALYPIAALAVGEEFTALRNMGKTAIYACKRKCSIAAAARRHALATGKAFEVRVRDADTVYCLRTK